MKAKFIKLSDKAKITMLTVSALICGLILIFISALPEGKNNNTVKTRLDAYVEATEARLCKTISEIEGAGKTEVFITTSNTFETVYASNASVGETASGKTTEKSLAYAGSSSYTSSPVVVKELCPDIKGVLIVCEGGNDKDIKDEITKSVSIALGISQTKIHLTGGTDKP